MKIEIITKENCQYCVKAKILLEKKNLAFTQRIYPDDISYAEIVHKYPDAKTFPIITVDGEYIGGYDQLSRLLKDYEPDESISE